MLKQLKVYKSLNRNVLFIVIGQLFMQLTASCAFLIFNLFMRNSGYDDVSIGNYNSFRFLAIGLVAFPLGLFIKSRMIKPFLILGGLMVPAMTLIVIYVLKNHIYHWIIPAMLLWGLGFAFVRVTALPLILRLSSKELQQEAIALSFSVWSLSVFLVGISNFTLATLNPEYFTDERLLQMFSLLGFVSVIFFLFVKEVDRKEAIIDLKGYNWYSILQVTFPTLLIATGAGLTIQFINLFFESVFGLQYREFSLMGSAATILVFVASLAVPYIRKKYDYEFAITFVQCCATLVLILLASTELVSHKWWAVYLAVFLFIIRQPLMNMAGPASTDLAMNMVGKRNWEMVVALNVTYWTGSWFVSAQIFRILRSFDYAYSSIFYLTALLYVIGIILYYLLIKKYKRDLLHA